MSKDIDPTKSNRFERIWLLAKIEFKLRYYENKLGLLWALIKPVSQLLIYFFAFKIIMRNDIPNFALYLFSGLILWEFFVEATIGLTLILQTKKYLYEYSNMSKLEIYMASMISISLGFMFNFLILMGFILLAGIEINFNLFYFPIVFIIAFLFSFGVALILSNLYVKAKDVHQIWPLASQFIMWLSPLFFGASDLQNNIPGIAFFNPMFGIMVNLRNVTLRGISPDFYLLGLNCIHVLLVLGIGFLLLKSIGKKASEIL